MPIVVIQSKSKNSTQHSNQGAVRLKFCEPETERELDFAAGAQRADGARVRARDFCRLNKPESITYHTL